MTLRWKRLPKKHTQDKSKASFETKLNEQFQADFRKSNNTTKLIFSLLVNIIVK